MSGKPAVLSPEALDFAPGLLSIQESPPARLPRAVMYTVGVLFVILLLWAFFGKLDIIASAEGRLVPETYIKIVQPSDAGIVQEILVREGEQVQQGQVLMRMDTQPAILLCGPCNCAVSMPNWQARRWSKGATIRTTCSIRLNRNTKNAAHPTWTHWGKPGRL
jgi:hypothetical protein